MHLENPTIHSEAYFEACREFCLLPEDLTYYTQDPEKSAYVLVFQEAEVPEVTFRTGMLALSGLNSSVSKVTKIDSIVNVTPLLDTEEQRANFDIRLRATDGEVWFNPTDKGPRYIGFILPAPIQHDTKAA